jgi:hypothetical protein
MKYLAFYLPTFLSFGAAAFLVFFPTFAWVVAISALVLFGLFYAIAVSAIIQKSIEAEKSMNQAGRGGLPTVVDPGFKSVTIEIVEKTLRSR